MESTIKNIKKYGWESQYIFDEKEEKEPFMYTVGLETSYGHPELMIFGLKREAMHGILSDISYEIKKGLVVRPNQRLSGLLSGDFEVMFKEVKTEFHPEYLGVASRYYKKKFRALVLFWPDRNNLLPFEDGCEVKVQDEALQII